MVKGYEGKLVRLVPLEKERHLENCYRWINDPELCENLVFDGPMTWRQEEEWFDRVSKAESDVVFAIETLDGVHLGNSGVHAIDYRNGRAKTGSYIADPRQRGKGYGTDAARTRARFCFEVLGLRLLLSSHLGNNTASERMQEKAGYLACGVVPQAYWKRGRYVDEAMTYLARERYLELRGQW